MFGIPCIFSSGDTIYNVPSSVREYTKVAFEFRVTFSNFCAYLCPPAYLRNKSRESGTSGRELNILCVDWSALSKEIMYFDSVEYTKMAGRRVGEFLHFLHQNGFLPAYAQLHLVGFSLGAHVAGIAGNFVEEVTGGRERVGRITGKMD